MKSIIKASFKAFSKSRARSPDRPGRDTEYDSIELDSSDDGEESGQLSDSSDEDYSGRSFFSPEDTQLLLKAVRATMQLEDVKQTRSVADQAFQALGPKKHRVFPIHENMQAIINREWKNPDRNFFLPSSVKRKYPYEEKVSSSWDRAPTVDAPVAKIAKRSALPFDDLGCLSDPLDKKADIYLKRAWETSATCLRPVVAATWVSRSLRLWIEQLEAHLKEKKPREEILASLPTFAKAADFLTDASTDVMRFAAKSSAMTNAARRAIWLRSWKGDQGSKARLCALPCEGDRLFGSSLDDILEKASDKKKGFPVPQKTPFFRRPQQGFRKQRGKPYDRKERDRFPRKTSGFLFKTQDSKPKDKQ
ncbi:lamina-associated polypeptide 2, isoforms alpha/zeta-like isoform X2 [Bufo gargarizans]|uniref:lamina-associated polypeptide 2, isoforms alpha/zeta-like isoform X2 n=1 Tax=Bufo gargarizans TaxID=30331 RepID=UPI001CF1B921|nr:lamina-associated polypeptide 2, isoforms alpha/zeta-like isoform X2 [Bufo gargarizans]